jgi:hypothetical protein
MSADLKLYRLHTKGMRYLLAQSPDTKNLVPDIPEAHWEPVGTKKDVKVGLHKVMATVVFGSVLSHAII